MTSSWRHKRVYSTCYVLSTCQVSSSCEVCKYVFFVDNLSAEEGEEKKKKTIDWCLYWQTLGVREERKVKFENISSFQLPVWTGSNGQFGVTFR